ncbi:HAD family hydrolase [Marinobacterium jannaschii]|uniref:HAD family hydrolase n=1 Tax=Marinobacterium jannaschii TaxID=64970 RepID=UPI0004884425|nr:HAD family hydrolase [Marinobacterium jannaschii]
MHLVMFDIDGTLVQSTGQDVSHFTGAVHDVLGVHISTDWRDYQHVTDSGILRQVLQQTVPRKVHGLFYRRIRQRFIDRLKWQLKHEPSLTPPIPGAGQFIERLEQRDDVTIAIATGGWLETAILKMQAAGIYCRDRYLASSSDDYDRTRIMRIAEQRALSGRRPLSRTYFGDGEWDREACQRLCYDFIAIGNRVDHQVAFSDFSDPNAILAQMNLNRPE